jgi:hypothetical protein
MSGLVPRILDTKVSRRPDGRALEPGNHPLDNRILHIFFHWISYIQSMPKS